METQVNRFFVQVTQDPAKRIDEDDSGEVWYDDNRDEFYVQIGSDLYTRRLANHGGYTDDLGNKYILCIKQNFVSMAEMVFESVGTL
jgi:hypothetical protein